MTIEDEALEIPVTPAAVTPSRGIGAVGTWTMLAAAAFIIVAVALAFAGFSVVKQREAKLETRVAALEQKVATLSSQSATPSQPAPAQTPVTASAGAEAAIATLTQKVQDLQLAGGNHDTLMQTIGNLQNTVVGLQGTLQTLSQSVDADRTKLAALDQEVTERRSENARQFAILLSVDQLRAAAETSDPFETELNASRLIARNDPDLMKALDALTPYAGDGAPTLNELRGEFSDIASEIVRGNVVDNKGKWYRQALYRLSSVISIRRIGTHVEGNGAEAIVARAEARLEEDDLAGAVQALKALDDLPHDYPKSVAAGWIDAAGRRLAVTAALTDLDEIAIDRVNGLAEAPAAAPIPAK